MLYTMLGWPSLLPEHHLQVEICAHWSWTGNKFFGMSREIQRWSVRLRTNRRHFLKKLKWFNEHFFFNSTIHFFLFIHQNIEQIYLARNSKDDLYSCKIQFPAGFAKDTYSYDEYFKRYGRFEYHQNRWKMCIFKVIWLSNRKVNDEIFIK